jgi:hypothetical protein
MNNTEIATRKSQTLRSIYKEDGVRNNNSKSAVAMVMSEKFASTKIKKFPALYGEAVLLKYKDSMLYSE